MSHLPANWQPPEPPKVGRSRNTIVPALITIACTFLLFVGAAFGAIASCGYSGMNHWFPFFTGLTVILFLVFLGATVWFLAAVIAAFFRPANKEDS